MPKDLYEYLEEPDAYLRGLSALNRELSPVYERLRALKLTSAPESLRADLEKCIEERVKDIVEKEFSPKVDTFFKSNLPPYLSASPYYALLLKNLEKALIRGRRVYTLNDAPASLANKVVGRKLARYYFYKELLASSNMGRWRLEFNDKLKMLLYRTYAC